MIKRLVRVTMAGLALAAFSATAIPARAELLSYKAELIASGNLSASFDGSATRTESNAAGLMAGRWYVNLHTAAYPAGEIRGQVVK